MFGGAGVDIFFVISGFIMVYTTMDREITPWSFMADRIARIVPAYWAATLGVLSSRLLRRRFCRHPTCSGANYLSRWSLSRSERLMVWFSRCYSSAGRLITKCSSSYV